MKNNSIREALPRLAKYMILCMILLILPANIGFQMYIHHENQKASANEMFRQVGLLIETNEKDMEEVKNDFSERCIRAADMAAYFVQYNPEVKYSLERTRELAKKLDVDELHYFSREGKICGGTHPEYYGLSFDSGEQMSFFLPMLQDPSLKLCQDITPNTGEGKQMQYAAVWMADGSGIIQIGMEPRRVFEEMEKKSLSGMIANMPSVNYGDFLIIDAQSETIVAATADEHGFRDLGFCDGVVFRQYNHGFVLHNLSVFVGYLKLGILLIKCKSPATNSAEISLSLLCDKFEELRPCLNSSICTYIPNIRSSTAPRPSSRSSNAPKHWG